MLEVGEIGIGTWEGGLRMGASSSNHYAFEPPNKERE
jgi:hypothetical protein